MNDSLVNDIVLALRRAEVVAYPTEAVYGLGCDPDNWSAVEQLLALKQRTIDKGLILVAANYQQLQPYVDDTQLNQSTKQTMLESWPGHITWVLPARATTPHWLTGRFTTLAVRVSAHSQVRQLCLALGKPLVSTSANISGLPPCRTLQEVRQQFGDQLPVLAGETGGYQNPSVIRDAMTGDLLRSE